MRNIYEDLITEKDIEEYGEYLREHYNELVELKEGKYIVLWHHKVGGYAFPVASFDNYEDAEENADLILNERRQLIEDKLEIKGTSEILEVHNADKMKLYIYHNHQLEFCGGMEYGLPA